MFLARFWKASLSKSTKALIKYFLLYSYMHIQLVRSICVVELSLIIVILFSSKILSLEYTLRVALCSLILICHLCRA